MIIHKYIDLLEAHIKINKHESFYLSLHFSQIIESPRHHNPDWPFGGVPKVELPLLILILTNITFINF